MTPKPGHKVEIQTSHTQEGCAEDPVFLLKYTANVSAKRVQNLTLKVIFNQNSRMSSLSPDPLREPYNKREEEHQQYTWSWYSHYIDQDRMEQSNDHLSVSDVCENFMVRFYPETTLSFLLYGARMIR